ncbi:hypothetical protein [Larkinella knui]
MLISSNACQNPVDDVLIGFKDPIEKGIVEIRFKSLKGAIPKTIELVVTGPDADEVVTTLNTTSYKVNEDGVLLLAASPEATYSKSDPLTFSVAAQSAGYLDIIQGIQLADTGRYTVSPAWIKMSDPPAHLSATQVTEIQTPLAAGLTVSTPVINQKKDNITVLLEPGSEFKGADGAELNGPITVALWHVENRGNSPAQYLPDGPVLSAVTGSGGESLGSLQLSQIAGAFSLELHTKQFEVVQQISKPVSCVMSLNPEVSNPALGRPIQPGDAIPLYRYDRTHWQQEKPTLVTRNSSTGQLECKVTLSQTGIWVAGWTQAVCEEGPVFAVSSNLNRVDIKYLCKVVDATTRQELRSFYTFLNNGDRITLTHLLQNQEIRFQVYNYNDAYSSGNPGQPLLETAPLQTCNRTPQTLDLQKLPTPPPIDVSFDFACPPPTTLNESLLPARIRLQYSESGKRNWRDLVTLERKSVKAISYKLQVKKPYDIRVSTDGGATWPLERSRFVPDNNTLKFDLASPEFCK